MIANDILLDAFTRVHESLHRTLGDITPEELFKRAASLDRVAHQSSHGQQCLPAFRPRATVAVRLVSVLENAMTNGGQISYLKAYHRLGGWFPREAKDPASVR
jgi:hypothetical protein